MEIDKADTFFVLFCASSIFLMGPACGYFYSGAVEFKNAISLLLLTLLINCVVTLQFYLFGYSLSFSTTSGNSFIGNFELGAIHTYFDVNATHPFAPTINAMAFLAIQTAFATITPIIAFGGAAERLRFFPFAIFIFVWTTIVYDPVCYWVFSPNGWLLQLGVQDYAGGIVIHTVAGMTGLALALSIGKRNQPHEITHSLPFAILGTVLLWFGWPFFNAGSAYAMNARAVLAYVNTNIGGCAGGLTWLIIDYSVHRKCTTMGFCCGVIAGFVCITPASGFTLPHYAIIYGAAGSILSNRASLLKNVFKFDDTLDTFPVHAVTGMFGSIMNGIFSTKTAISLDGVNKKGGFLDGQFVQLGYQIAGVVVVALWSFVLTFVLVKSFSLVPSLNLRLTAEQELAGSDIALFGEIAYDYKKTNTMTDSNQKFHEDKDDELG